VGLAPLLLLRLALSLAFGLGPALVPVPVARAGGFELPDQSAVAGATGGAGTARAEDPSAAFYNPASLADAGGFRGALGLLLAIPSMSAEAIEEPRERASTVSGVSLPPHLHLSYAENEWAVGGYVGVSHGTSIVWPEGWWGRYESMASGLLVLRIAPFVALRLGGERGLLRDAPDVRIALSAHVDVARAENRRMLDFIDQEGQVHLLFWGAGVGGGASLFWQATPELAFGLSYRSRTWMRAEGDADFTVPDPFLGRAPDQRASTEIVIPDRLVIGAAYRQPVFAIFADVGWTAWSVRDRQRVDFASERTADLDVPQRWRDTVVFRLGGEVRPTAWLRARAGLYYDMEAAPSDTLAPSAPDTARIGVTFGAGVDVTREVGLDASYAYVAFLEREADGDDAPLARYWGELHLVALTLRLAVGGASAAPGARAADAPEGDARGDAASGDAAGEAGAGVRERGRRALGDR
jgi:long-chain fatty acid transport protein